MLRRQFHSSALRSFKQKTSGSNKKLDAPYKTAGEHRNFRRAAAHTSPELRAPAPEVSGLELLSPTSSTGMYAFPDEVGVSLTRIGSFASQKNKELFRHPTTLFRQQTVELVNQLDNSRKLLLGPSGVGKSALLTQLHAAAKCNDWAVLHISQAKALTDGHTDHVATESGVWLQPMLVDRWFKSIHLANPDLSPECMTILKSKDANQLDKLFEQLEKDGKKVLLSVDGINAWTHAPYAENRDRENQKIYHGDLQIPRIFLEFFSGARKLNGAVFATTTGLYDTNATINSAFGRQEAPAYSPITEFDPVLSEKLKNVEPVDVQYMTVDEARVWIDYLAQAGIAKDTSDITVYERYALSGGNPRYLLKSFVNYSF